MIHPNQQSNLKTQNP
uniref:Uncharacterized protein n=1 Tax=Anguilla anguilla TaxID=7936 RepID=A0A0E9Q8C6_ANGAN